MLSFHKTPKFLRIESLNKEIINILSGIAREERFLIEEGKGQSLETLIKPLHEFMTHCFLTLRFVLFSLPVKNIPSVVHLVILHVPPITPHSRFHEMDLQVPLSLELDRKPSVVPIQFVEEFEERALLHDLVAVLVLNVSQHLEKLQILYLRVPQNVSQGVGEGGFNFEKRLQSNPIDFLETFPIKMRKMLDLKFFNKLLTGLRQK